MTNKRQLIRQSRMKERERREENSRAIKRGGAWMIQWSVSTHQSSVMGIGKSACRGRIRVVEHRGLSHPGPGNLRYAASSGRFAHGQPWACFYHAAMAWLLERTIWVR